MGEVESTLFKALFTLSLNKYGRGSPLSNALEKMAHDGENITIVVKSISSEGSLFEPRRIMVELEDWSELVPGSRRPRADYEATAEEIVEIEEAKKELPSGG